MAKGTLQSAAKTTKKGSGSSASLKAGKSAIIGDAASAPASASKRSKKSTTTSASASSESLAAPAVPSSDDIVLVVDGKEKRKLNVKDPRYMRHYKMIVKESLEGGEMRTSHCNVLWKMGVTDTKGGSSFNI